MPNFYFADEEMRAVYGTDEGHECRDCGKRDKAYCNLTNKRKKCADYGFACGKFVESDRHRFVVK